MKKFLMICVMALLSLSMNVRLCCAVHEFQIGSNISAWDIEGKGIPYITDKNRTEIDCLVTEKEKAEVLSVIPAGYVDLGLPSGTLWKDKNESDFFTYAQAVSRFGSSLPSSNELKELMNVCQWSWTGSGYRVTGPNGESIYLPAAGWRDTGGTVWGVGSYGYYWSSTPSYLDYSEEIHFSSDDVSMSAYFQGNGYSVRLVQVDSRQKAVREETVRQRKLQEEQAKQKRENEKKAEKEEYDALCSKYGKEYVDAILYDNTVIVGAPESMITEYLKAKRHYESKYTRSYHIYNILGKTILDVDVDVKTKKVIRVHDYRD